jgi:hypothetical protein
LGKKLGNMGFYAYIYYVMIEKLNPPFMIATFRVYFPTGDFPNTTEPETTYQLEYSSSQELAHLHEEARRVWSEYMVEVETDGMIMSSSSTYAEDCSPLPVFVHIR